MIEFISLNFKINPKYIYLLEQEMTNFKWLSEFIEIEQDGKINLFSIHNGLLKDAIEQSIRCFLDNKEATESIELNIEANDGNETLKYTFYNNILKEYYIENETWKENI